MLLKYKKNAYIVLFFLALYVYSRFLLRATGDGHPKIVNILLICGLCSLLFSSKKRFFISVPFLLVLSIYAPIGFTYGYPTYQYVSSLFATNLGESLEFLRLIPIKAFLYTVILFITPFILSHFALKMNIKPCRNKLFLMLFSLLSIYSANALVFLDKTEASVLTVEKEYKDLNEYANKNNWINAHQSSKTKYDDYFLVIGESARRDYFHAYGYPLKNTPFLDSTNGVIVDGLESAGTYTIGSLRLMLTQGDKKKWSPDYNLNIMGLANKAGFNTYWISNQGQFGKWDTPISSIGKQSNHNYFTKSQGYSEDNVSDFELLNILKPILNTKSDGHRLFVIHTMGSHPYACDRIKGMKDQLKVQHKINSYIACYASSIKQTDDFLSKLHDLISQDDKGRSFSMIYFSDHGMVHREINGVIQLNNNYVSKYHHDIPLVKISSDDTDRKVFSTEKSGLMFVNGLASWMGINAKQIQQYDLFDGVPDKQDYGLSQQPYKVDDPAIDISSDLIK
ncbi:phosphoethanolamine transferase [Citrobacter portucalensis]|uniref:phosphoethanolamine transferase n=1 Tax=Citrobacter portucalensis TaxID=1639133 RepID=UPI00226B938E|nr:phosphoethanolamine transferase [Citrobacter portucalensis]MCX9068488.1 phosphoethanolamine transferase [Citrobacter portucalensis]